MRWLASNWFILVFVGGMAAMHLRHGRHRSGHGGGHHRREEDAAETADPGHYRPAASETTARNTLMAMARVQLLQPGVARYFRDAGLMP